VRSVTKAAIFVGERRWNLRLKDGLASACPRTTSGNALAALSKLDKEDRLVLARHRRRRHAACPTSGRAIVRGRRKAPTSCSRQEAQEEGR